MKKVIGMRSRIFLIVLTPLLLTVGPRSAIPQTQNSRAFHTQLARNAPGPSDLPEVSWKELPSGLPRRSRA
jgi:hypothetical protein